MTQVHILGAASGIGRWFAQQVFTAQHRLYVYDISAEVEQIYAEYKLEASPVYLNTDTPMADQLRYFLPDDWVLLAVPEENLVLLCEQLATVLPASVNVVVMTSRQAKPVALVASILRESRVFGLHPLFGPHVISPYGQTVAICSDQGIADAHEEQTAFLTDELSKAGLSVIHKNIDEHDQDMAYVQALTHFILLSFSHALGHSGQRMENLLEMRTPPFQFLTAFAARMLMQSPDTFAAIQVAEGHREIRQQFLAAAQELQDIFSAGPLDRAVKKITDIKDRFSLSMLEECMHYSGMAVSAIQEKEQFYIEKYQKGEPIVFRTSQTLRYRVGVINKVSDFSLELTEFMTRVEVDGRALIPYPVSDSAQRAYRKKGISIKLQTGLKIRKEHMELLPFSEVKVWFKGNLLPLHKTHSFSNSMGLKAEFVVFWLQKIFTNIWECYCLDEHKDKTGAASLTLALVLHPATEVEQLKQDIQRYLEGNIGKKN